MSTHLSASDRTTRRRLLAAVAAAGAMLPALRGAALAQEATPPAAQGSPRIVSTGRGEVPSFGGRRPGPVAQPAPRRERAAGVAPTGLRIEQAGVDAPVEALRVADGALPDPTGPWVVAWYENLGRLGTGDNVVMAGHIDYWNVGPSVFFSLAQLQPGAEIVALGDDGQDYAYAVEWVRQYDAANAPLEELVGPVGADALTLFTCGGTFDSATGQYLQRTVVRALRQG